MEITYATFLEQQAEHGDLFFQVNTTISFFFESLLISLADTGYVLNNFFLMNGIFQLTFQSQKFQCVVYPILL